MVLLCLGQLDRAAHEHANDIDDLIEVREREEEPDDQVEYHDRREAELVEHHVRELLV